MSTDDEREAVAELLLKTYWILRDARKWTRPPEDAPPELLILFEAMSDAVLAHLRARGWLDSSHAKRLRHLEMCDEADPYESRAELVDIVEHERQRAERAEADLRALREALDDTLEVVKHQAPDLYEALDTARDTLARVKEA